MSVVLVCSYYLTNVFLSVSKGLCGYMDMLKLSLPYASYYDYINVAWFLQPLQSSLSETYKERSPLKLLHCPFKLILNNTLYWLYYFSQTCRDSAHTVMYFKHLNCYDLKVKSWDFE